MDVGVIADVKSHYLRSTVIVIPLKDGGKCKPQTSWKGFTGLAACHWEHLSFTCGDQHSPIFTNSLSCSLQGHWLCYISFFPWSLQSWGFWGNSSCDLTNDFSQRFFGDSSPATQCQASGAPHDPFMPSKPVSPGRHMQQVLPAWDVALTLSGLQVLCANLRKYRNFHCNDAGFFVTLMSQLQSMTIGCHSKAMVSL